MIRLRLLLLLVATAVLPTGCASTDNTTAGGTTDANGNSVSSVPWNRPESWETSGQLGAMGK